MRFVVCADGQEYGPGTDQKFAVRPVGIKTVVEG